MTDIPDFLPEFSMNLNPDSSGPGGEDRPDHGARTNEEGGASSPHPEPRPTVFAETVETDDSGRSLTTRIVEFTAHDSALALHAICEFILAVITGQVAFSDSAQRNRVLGAAMDARDRFSMVTREGDMPT